VDFGVADFPTDECAERKLDEWTERMRGYVTAG
jgi:hypothetical protein